jgi:uncharacterized protein (DUF488 family)
MTIWTIGHSTRLLDELINTLKEHQIEGLVDVRFFPTSKRYPYFNCAPLSVELARSGVSYEWLGKMLGGYRKSERTDSPHVALRSQGFRAYADHMQSPEFQLGIGLLLRFAEKRRTAYMCAERFWWRCHRRFISDYLVAICHVNVMHILDQQQATVHRLNPIARVEADHLIYDCDEQASLF